MSRSPAPLQRDPSGVLSTCWIGRFWQIYACHGRQILVENRESGRSDIGRLHPFTKAASGYLLAFARMQLPS